MRSNELTLTTVAPNASSVISMSYQDGVFAGGSRGTRAFVTEITEQFVWLENAMRLPDSKTHNVWLTCPILLPLGGREAMQPPAAPGSFPNMLYFKSSSGRQAVTAPEYPENGQCWHELFHTTAIVQGYPIPRRAAQDLGLEISLKLMASLAQARNLNIFRGVPMIKGFSTILYPTRQTSDSTTWHICYNEHDTHVSFEEGVSCYTPEIDSSVISTGRHLFGWCKNAEIYAGLYGPEGPRVRCADACLYRSCGCGISSSCFHAARDPR